MLVCPVSVDITCHKSSLPCCPCTVQPHRLLPEGEFHTLLWDGLYCVGREREKGLTALDVNKRRRLQASDLSNIHLQRGRMGSIRSAEGGIKDIALCEKVQVFFKSK